MFALLKEFVWLNAADDAKSLVRLRHKASASPTSRR
jgi:hypothetical protein